MVKISDLDQNFALLSEPGIRCSIRTKIAYLNHSESRSSEKYPYQKHTKMQVFPKFHYLNGSFIWGLKNGGSELTEAVSDTVYI